MSPRASKLYVVTVLGLAVFGGAAVTRPSEASFHARLQRRIRARLDSGDRPLALSLDRSLFPENYAYKNRYLWAEMSLDGKPAYTGAFGHWFQCGRGQ